MTPKNVSKAAILEKPDYEDIVKGSGEQKMVLNENKIENLEVQEERQKVC